MSDLTRFEVTRLVSARALQIEFGAPTLVKAVKDATPYDVAKLEYSKKVLPMSVIREYPDGTVRRLEL